MYYDYRYGQGEAAIYFAILLLISPIVDTVFFILPFWGRAQLLKMTGRNPWLCIVPFAGTYLIAKAVLPKAEAMILTAIGPVIFLALVIFGSGNAFGFVCIVCGIAWLFLRWKESGGFKEPLCLTTFQRIVFAFFRPGYYLWIFVKKYLLKSLPITLPSEVQ